LLGFLTFPIVWKSFQLLHQNVDDYLCFRFRSIIFSNIPNCLSLLNCYCWINCNLCCDSIFQKETLEAISQELLDSPENQVPTLVAIICCLLISFNSSYFVVSIISFSIYSDALLLELICESSLFRTIAHLLTNPISSTSTVLFTIFVLCSSFCFH
jgi:hypothetical protein